MNASPYKKFGSKSRTIVVFLFAFLSLSAATAQKTLTPAELEKFGVTAKTKVQELQMAIQTVANKTVDETERNMALGNAVALFIPGAKMEVSAIRSGITQKSIIPIRQYFARLKSLTYKSVEVKYYDLCYLSDFILGIDGKYHATATIYQEFTAVTNEGKTYKDRTTKTIDVVAEWMQDQFFKEKRWIIRFGDVKVTETLAV